MRCRLQQMRSTVVVYICIYFSEVLQSPDDSDESHSMLLVFTLCCPVYLKI